MTATPHPTKEASSPDGLVMPIAEDYPKQRSDVGVRVVEGETLVLDRQGGQIHQLNRTASYIWDRCNGKTSVAEIANQLAEAFDIVPETAARDVSTIVSQLQKLDLIESCRQFIVLSKLSPSRKEGSCLKSNRREESLSKRPFTSPHLF